MLGHSNSRVHVLSECASSSSSPPAVESALLGRRPIPVESDPSIAPAHAPPGDATGVIPDLSEERPSGPSVEESQFVRLG